MTPSARSLAALAVTFLACSKDPPKGTATADSTAATQAGASQHDDAPGTAASAPARVADPTFVLELVPPDACKAGADCVATLKLQALGEFHINDEGFPYAFKADDVEKVKFLGKEADGRQFSLKAGDFKQQAEKLATMEVRFRASAAGRVRISGKYYMAVCTAQNCKPVKPSVAVDVTVL